MATPDRYELTLNPPERQKGEFWLREKFMFRPYHPKDAEPRPVDDGLLQKVAQMVLMVGPAAVLLFLHAPWIPPGRSGMFDYGLRQYSKGTKLPLSQGKKRMVRGPSVLFDSDEFRAQLDPRRSAEPMTVWDKYQQWCQRRPLVTKALTAAILAVLGDLVVQYLRTRDKRGELAKLSVEALQKLRPSLGHGLFPLHQPLQTDAFALHGLLLAPLLAPLSNSPRPRPSAGLRPVFSMKIC